MNQLMIEEARSTPTLLQDLLMQADQRWRPVVDAIRKRDPQQVVTIARGSSDHAAQFLSYMLAQKIGLIPASLPPSLTTLHAAPLRWQGALAVAVSQSGASPDLCRTLEEARNRGALTLAVVNQEDSPLARIAQHVVPLGAGEEKSVAATKTFLLSAVQALLLTAHWSDDRSLLQAVRRLPFFLERALQATESETLRSLKNAPRLFVIGRGQTLPMAQEVALKFMEVCCLPALAYSAAEFRHGPMAIIRERDPVVVIGARGPELPGLISTVQFLRDMGAAVTFIAPQGTTLADIMFPVDEHPAADPVLAVQILYPLIAQLSVLRGFNPDQPAHLRKVTMTL